MKNKKLAINLIIILSVFCIIGFALQRKSAEASNGVDLRLNLSKKVFYLGETLFVESKVTNNTSLPIYLEGDSDYAVRIKILDKESGDYKLYVSQGPLISLDGVYLPVEINSKESFSSRSTVLWNTNFLPKTKNLSPEAAKSYTDGKILSDYAFSEAGNYYIKAVATVIKDKKPISVESEPIEITITEPVGEDLEVWDLMKNNSDIGYFIQTGELVRGKYYQPEERTKFQAEVEDILQKYPNSFYAQSLRQSLDKFKANEAKRQEFAEKLKSQQKPKP